MNKDEVLNTLDDFKDEYGMSYSSSELEAMSIIEDALDLYFKIIEKFNAVGNIYPVTMDAICIKDKEEG